MNTDNNNKVITSSTKSWILGVISSLVYAVSYIGRLNYSAALPFYLKENILTKPQGGLISTTYFFAYGIGQLVNGVVADHINPLYQVILGSIGSALINLYMSTTSDFYCILFVWTLNGFFQSMIWAPLLLLLSSKVQGKSRNGVLWLLNTAPAIGAVLAYFVSSTILRKLHWLYLFRLAGLIIVTVIVVFCFLYRYSLVGGVEYTASACSSGAREKLGKRDIRHLITGTGLAIIVIPVMIHGMLKDGTTNWIPTLITEYFGTTQGSAVALAIVPQLANLFAASLAYFLFKVVKDEIYEVIMLFVASSISIIGLVLCGNHSVVVAIGCFACVTLSMQAANVVFVSLIAERFQEFGFMATVSGGFNSLAYIGCAISVYFVALISDISWMLTLIFWLVSSLLALAICFMVRKSWKHIFDKNNKLR